MQPYQQWQQSPFTPADENFLIETLVQCRHQLESVLKTAQDHEKLPDLTEAIEQRSYAVNPPSREERSQGNRKLCDRPQFPSPPIDKGFSNYVTSQAKSRLPAVAAVHAVSNEQRDLHKRNHNPDRPRRFDKPKLSDHRQEVGGGNDEG